MVCFRRFQNFSGYVRNYTIDSSPKPTRSQKRILPIFWLIFLGVTRKRCHLSSIPDTNPIETLSVKRFIQPPWNLNVLEDAKNRILQCCQLLNTEIFEKQILSSRNLFQKIGNIRQIFSASFIKLSTVRVAI